MQNAQERMAGAHSPGLESAWIGTRAPTLTALLESVERWQRELLGLEATTERDTELLGQLLAQAFKMREAILELRVEELCRAVARGRESLR